MIKSLKQAELFNFCDPEELGFKSTFEIDPIDSIIGQIRAQRAIEFAFAMQQPGYNVYMAGLTGTGKLTYAQNFAKEWAKQVEQPNDWCYFFNFEKNSQPKAVSLPPGIGKAFKKDMEELIDSLREGLPKVFEGEESDNQKAEILEGLEVYSEELMSELNKVAEEMGFLLRRTSTGFISLPVIDGQTISEESFEELPEEKQLEIESNSALLQEKASEITSKIKKREKNAQKQIKELERKLALYVMGDLIWDLAHQYEEHEVIINYLKEVQEDIINNLEDYKTTSSDDEDGLGALLGRRKGKDPYSRYQINLLVDNSQVVGAPVIFEPNPTFANLVGRVEYENELGTLSTDHRQIKAGSIHKANGGVLIVQAKDILAHSHAWEALKRVLRAGEVRIENPSDSQGATVIATLQPEPIQVKLKVVITGSLETYQILYSYDEEFQKLFKIKADFDDEMVRSKDNILKMASFIGGHCLRADLKHFSASGVAKVVEYSSRLAENQEKLSTCFNYIVEIIYEADAWARIAKADLVEAEHVERAIQEKIFRSNLYEEKLGEMINKGNLLITTEGMVEGQINGLTILDIGDYSFGKPNRITAATFVGEEGVINIERETRMTGRVHDKGLLVLSGYLGSTYAQDHVLSLSASLCFEQLYDGLDGDSASIAELFALLSSLSGKKIDQGIAVTGSLNQKGEVQPIGGVNEKIEGFFYTCLAQGLTGKQGVIIPHQNTKNLMLSKDVRDVVEKGKFHIYPIKHVDEGLEIVMRSKPSTIHRLVKKKLRGYGEVLAQFCQAEQK